jgi:thymidylate synthase
MNSLDKKYKELLQDILDNGVKKEDRTGTGTLSVFGRQIRHKMSEGFPLLTTKKMYFKGIVTELLWFLRGDTNIKYLVDNDCHIWDGDAYKAFERWKQETDAKIRKENPTIDFQPLEYESKEEFINKIKTDTDFAEKWGELGPIYGKQWRSWAQYSVSEVTFGTGSYTAFRREIDQIANLINDLKTNPDSRRLMVSAWNVGELDQMTLPPCHYGFQVYTRELSLEERNKWAWDNWGITCEMESVLDEQEVPKRAISLMWNQRSVDTFLGLPFNIASYGLLLEIIAKEVNMVPDELIGNLGDTHLYLNHIEQSKEQIGRELTIEERIDLASKKYENFDIMDFGIPFTCTHDDIDEYYPVPKRTREPYPLPKLNIKLHFDNDPSFVPEYWLVDDFEIKDYTSHPPIKAPLSN